MSQWLCRCGNWNLGSKEQCPSCGRARPVPIEQTPGVCAVAAPCGQTMRQRLTGILAVLGYELHEERVWAHPFGPTLKDEDLGERGRIPNEAALVRWIFEEGLSLGGHQARQAMREALGLPWHFL